MGRAGRAGRAKDETMTYENFLTMQTRRHFFGRAARGLGTVALASLLNPALLAGPNRGAKNGLAGAHLAGGALGGVHFSPRAKRVIYLFQSGAPSQLDLFD